jgi:hypothetical protein
MTSENALVLKLRMRETSRRHYLENKDYYRAKDLKWRQDNPVAAKAIQDRHYAAHPVRVRFCWIRSNAPRRGLVFSISYVWFYQFWTETPHVCAYCGITREDLKERFGDRPKCWWNDLTVDRVDSSQGYTPENIVKACYSCNAKKDPLRGYKGRFKARR